mgnify:CR=1 FL=1|jgi:hypothetical protein
MAEGSQTSPNENRDGPMVEDTSVVGSSHAPARRKRNRSRNMLLKHAAPKLGYKSAGAVQYWITEQGAPGEKDEKGRWVVDLKEIHRWAIDNGKKVPTLPFDGAASDSSDESEREEDPQLEFDTSLLPKSRAEQIAKCQATLSYLMMRMDRLSRAHQLDTGAIQRVGQTIKSVSEELRQLEKAEAQSSINDGRYIAREDVERSVAAMAAAWLDGLSKSESEVITSIMRAIDDADAGGVDRDSRRRLIEQVASEGFIEIRASIAASMLRDCPESDVATTEGAAP